MGSLMEEPNVIALDLMDSVVPKTEPLREDDSGSSVSTPDAEADSFPQDAPPTQKRKGGRKPIYATSEERKQRNRQAQAAFRERRTEYIKELESTIKRHEDALQTLQQNHRSAADECLMLRYKNSLLERILLEQGIDVQAELRLKSGSPLLGPTKVPAPTSQASPIQRAMMNRQQQARRLPTGIAPKLEPIYPMVHASREGVFSNHSPQLQPTPPSQTSSPSTSKSPGFAMQGGISPTAAEFQAQQQQQQQLSRPQQRPPRRSLTQPTFQPMEGLPAPGPQPNLPLNTTATMPGVPSAYYPSPFQKHYDQLDQEYDAQADMLDDEIPEELIDTDNYVPNFGRGSIAHTANSVGLQGQPAMVSPGSTQTGDPSGPVFGAANQLYDAYDPMLDADPFGLTASMHFPTPFNYEQSQQRQ